jgi:arginyl-tRNA--protein-N-Asp/Glu arginylyltransferase
MAEEKKEAPKYKGRIFATDPDFDINDVDGVFPDGSYDRGPDWLYAVLFEEEKGVYIRDDDENIDEYWAEGWLSGYSTFHRGNFDSYRGRYYKSFPTRYRIGDIYHYDKLFRIWKKNRDLQSVVRPLRITPEKSDLWDTYQYLRHGEMLENRLIEVYKHINWFPSDLMEVCVFKEDKLIACSIFESGNKAIFSQSCFWDASEAKRSLGHYTVMLELMYAGMYGMSYYYMGNYHKENPKFQYKLDFPGLELFDWDNMRWVDFKDESVPAMLNQKLPRKKFVHYGK